MPFPNPDSQFRPGNRANPDGRPKGRSLTAIVREALELTRFKGKRLPAGKTVADLVAEAILARALRGDPAVIRELWNRLEGRVTLPIDVAGESFQTIFYMPDNGRDPGLADGPENDPADALGDRQPERPDAP
jgi:hypothetical protein